MKKSLPSMRVGFRLRYPKYLFEIYQTDVSAELISIVTEEVLDELTTWQSRPWRAITLSSISMGCG